MPHHELPELYRAADCFVTMSLSETFGLTCLEAQMCGCPSVMPYCSVFDEIWNGRTPKSWRYDIASVRELTAAIASASADEGRMYLVEHPVRATWADASTELLEQYEECIAMTRKMKANMREIVTLWDHCLRVAFGGVVATWVLSYYFIGLRRFGSMLAPISL